MIHPALALALVLALALPGVAVANVDPLAQAEMAWPGSPCAGSLDVVHDPLLPADRDGEFKRGTCTVVIRPGLPRERECDAIVHEAGHAAGFDGGGDHYGHAPAGQGIMALDGQGEWPGCHPPPTLADIRADARDEVRSVLPSPRAAWSVTCGPGLRFVCRASRARSSRRYRFVLTMSGNFDFAQLADRRPRRRGK